MGLRRTIARNAIWNWAGMGAAMLAGFIVAPFLVHRLGDTGYGLWILIGSFTGYFGLLDLGVRGSVGRNLAYHRARGDQLAVNSLLSTALGILCVPAFLTLTGTLAGQWFFFRIFDVPADQISAVRLALMLVGLNLAMHLLLSTFDGTLWALQRFDLLNAIDISVTLLRVGSTFWLVGSGGGLVALAAITLTCTLTGGTAKAITAFRIEPSLRIGIRRFTWASAGQLFGYGMWNFLLSVGTLITHQIGPMIIAARLSLGLITPFTVAGRLIGYAHSVFMAGHGVLTPLATSLHARQDRDRQQLLFLTGSRYCLAFSIFLMTSLLFLGQSFIVLWMGPDLASSHRLVTVLALGEILPLAQGVSSSLILATGRHRGMALVSVLENGLVLGLAFLLVNQAGLLGMCIALAIPGFLCRGVIRLILACRCADLSISTYLRQAAWPALIGSLLPVMGLGMVTRWHQPENWLELIGAGLAYAVLFGLSCILTFAEGRCMLTWLGHRMRVLVRQNA